MQFKPVCLVELWSDQEIEICNLVVLSHKGCSQTQFGVGLPLCENPAEHLGGDRVHLVQHHDAPLLLLNPLHRLLRLPTPPLCVGDHVEGGHEDAASHGFVLGVAGEPADHTIISCAPHLELLFPLFNADTRVAQHDCLFPHSAASGHSHQALSSTTRQYYNP